MLYFTLTASNTPEELVKAATLLLSTIKEQPKLTNAFRIEVEISNENVLFRVCIDSVSWYDVYLRTKSRTEAVMIAKKKAYTPCNRTSFHAKNLCEYDHTEHICMFPTEDYVMLLRQEIIRELLLASCPNKEKDNSLR
ncbi:unnamed protein product [Rhizophagus irregularis]|nr:unnamed protein product [Rhizophagus irregularis]